MFEVSRKMFFLKVACAIVVGLSLTLTACDFSSNEASIIVVSSNPEDDQTPASSSSDDGSSSSSAKPYAYGLERYKACDKKVEGRYVKYAYLYGGSGGPSSSASDGSYIEGGPGLDAYKDDFFKCEDSEWISVDENEVSADSDVFFVVAWKDDECDAEHEGVIDSVWNPNPSISTPIYFYRRCEKGEWIYKDRSVTCSTAGVAVGDTCRRAEIVDVAKRIYGNKVESQEQLMDKIYSYAGNGKWEKFDCNSALSETCSPTNDDLTYEKISKESGSYTYSIYCKCMDVVVGSESGYTNVGGKTYTYNNPIHVNKWHDVSENIYVPTEDSLAAASSFKPEEVRPCDKTLEIDGRVVKYEYKSALVYSDYEVNLSDSMSKYLYYKCEDDKWSILQEKKVDDDVLDSASVISFAELGERHLYDFKKCNADNDKAVDSLPSSDSKPASYDYYRCEQGKWTEKD